MTEPSTPTQGDEPKLTYEEIGTLFPDGIPIEVVNMIFNASDDVTCGEMRAKIRDVAAKSATRPEPDYRALAVKLAGALEKLKGSTCGPYVGCGAGETCIVVAPSVEALREAQKVLSEARKEGLIP